MINQDPRGRGEDPALERDHRAWEEQVEGVVPCSPHGAWSLTDTEPGEQERVKAAMHDGSVS